MYQLVGSLLVCVRKHAVVGWPISSMCGSAYFSKNEGGASSGIPSVSFTVTFPDRITSGRTFLIVAAKLNQKRVLCLGRGGVGEGSVGGGGRKTGRNSVPFLSAVPPTRHNNKGDALRASQFLFLGIPP